MKKESSFINKHGIARKFFSYLLVFTTLLTILETSLQLYMEYKSDVKLIQDRMEQIKTSYLQSLISSLWVSDIELLKVQMEGIVRLRDIVELNIEIESKKIIKVTSEGADLKDDEISEDLTQVILSFRKRLGFSNTIKETIPLYYQYKNAKMYVGSLTTVAHLQGVVHRMIDKIISILSFKSIKSFFLAAFLFYLFYTLVGKHLKSLASYVEALDYKNLDVPFQFHRKRKKDKHNDELDLLSQSINEMRDNLNYSFLDLDIANQELNKKIAEKIAVEKSLRTSEERYKSLFNHVPISLLEVDMSKIKRLIDLSKINLKTLKETAHTNKELIQESISLVEVSESNETSYQVFNVANKEELNNQLVQIFNTQSLIPLLDNMLDVENKKKKIETIIKVKTLTGNELFINLILYLAPGHEDSWSKVLISINDITELKKNEEKLKNLAFDLKLRHEELQEYLDITTHDLQEPLRKIQLFANRLSGKFQTQLNEEAAGYVERMRETASRMQTLVSALLTFTRVTTKHNPFVMVNMNELFKNILRDLDLRIEETNAKIEIADLPEVMADPTQMYHLFLNLVSNALKFHQKDVSPVIKIYGEIVNSQSKNLRNKISNYYKITIEDNGIGFDEKYLDRIFKIFQRLHNQSEYEGSGIGLALSKKIVERHGGSINVYSEENKGSRFIISIPIDK